tara:strand:- start:3565 stop:3843 length:279 start_codon:yes stop_codon:yes gene_type:complete
MYHENQNPDRNHSLFLGRDITLRTRDGDSVDTQYTFDVRTMAERYLGKAWRLDGGVNEFVFIPAPGVPVREFAGSEAGLAAHLTATVLGLGE